MKNRATWRQLVTNIDPHIKYADGDNNDVQIIISTWHYKWRELLMGARKHQSSKNTRIGRHRNGECDVMLWGMSGERRCGRSRIRRLDTLKPGPGGVNY